MTFEALLGGVILFLMASVCAWVSGGYYERGDRDQGGFYLRHTCYLLFLGGLVLGLPYLTGGPT